MYIKTRTTANQLSIIIDLRAIAHDAANTAELAKRKTLVARLITTAFETDEQLVNCIRP